MRSVALLLCGSLSLGGCFPENPKARTISKVTEGAFIVGGIAMLAANKGGQDCDMTPLPGQPAMGCHHEALGEVGFVLILAGLVGFIATISTTPDEKDPPIIVKNTQSTSTTFKARPLAGVGGTPAATAGSGSGAGTSAAGGAGGAGGGSGAPAPVPAH